MPYRPYSLPEDYEMDKDRVPWDKWGPEHQEATLKEAVGEDVWKWLEKAGAKVEMGS